MQQEKIAALKESIGSTDFWDNLVARRALDGHGGIEIAFGHHRLEALKELGIETIDIPLRNSMTPPCSR
jgi:ParB-like chromosome segregation protein Spo0J